MYFIGQTHIMNQLKDILPHLYESDEGMNILIRGPSGWGKTRMSFMICNYLSNGQFDYCLGDSFKFNSKFRVRFIDEVHLIQNPEVLYPLMDSGKYIFIIATNDAALLNEALVNRCTQFIFDRYTIPELREITKLSLRNQLSNELLDCIIDAGGGNPRIIKNLVSRLNIILARSPTIVKDMNLDTFKNLLEDVFGIKDGLDVMCTRYMECLESLGGTASLQTIASYIHIDMATIRYNIEPILLYKNKIKITNKGRSKA